MPEKPNVNPSVVLLLAIQNSAELRLAKFLDPDAKNMDERILTEHQAFATLANTWMNATNILSQVQAAEAQQRAAGTKIEMPFGRPH